MMPSYPQRQQRYIQLTGYNIRGKRTGKAKSAFYSLLEGFQAMDLHRKYTHTHTQHYNYLRSLIITHTHTHTHTSPRFMCVYIRISITISVYSTFANEYALNFTSLPQQLPVPSKIYPCINICILLPLLLFLSLSLSLFCSRGVS